MKIYLAVGLVLLLTSCSQKNTPESVLLNYIQYRFKESQSKAKILTYLGGDFASTVRKMKDTEFKKFLAYQDHKMKKFEILQKSCKETECSFIYILSHETFQKKEKVYTLEAKKTAELRLENKEWKIISVADMKTHLDIHKALK